MKRTIFDFYIITDIKSKNFKSVESMDELDIITKRIANNDDNLKIIKLPIQKIDNITLEPIEQAEFKGIVVINILLHDEVNQVKLMSMLKHDLKIIEEELNNGN